MNKTGISWTDLTWNPVSGCSKVSPGCQNCYAEAWSRRWKRTFDVQLHPEKLKEARKIPSGSKVFVNSMSDLFHESIAFPDIHAIFNEIRNRGDVIFQILTKRPIRAYQYVEMYRSLPYNCWLGVSVENSMYKDRIETLRRINVVNRFISFEPLIGDIGMIDLSGINWIIIGGESGPHHRPMKVEWAQNLVKQAKAQGVAAWMKQMGGSRPGGELKDFPEDLRIREFPHYELGGTP